jgi:hypothetical protein
MDTSTYTRLRLKPNWRQTGCLGTHFLVSHVELFAQQNRHHWAYVPALQLATKPAKLQSKYPSMNAAQNSSKEQQSRNPTKRITDTCTNRRTHRRSNSQEGVSDACCYGLEPAYDKKCDPSNNDKVPGPRSRAQTARRSPARSERNCTVSPLNIVFDVTGRQQRLCMRSRSSRAAEQ